MRNRWRFSFSCFAGIWTVAGHLGELRGPANPLLFAPSSMLLFTILFIIPPRERWEKNEWPTRKSRPENGDRVHHHCKLGDP